MNPFVPFAFLTGGLAYVLFLLPSALGEIKALKSNRNPTVPEEPGAPIREGSKIFVSATIEKSVDITDRLVASLVGPGAIAALWFSRRIIDLPTTLFSRTLLSLPLSTELTRLKGSKDGEGFSTVISNCVFEHIPGFREAFREIHRVLRPGGQYIFTAHSQNYNDFLYFPDLFKRMGLSGLQNLYLKTINRIFKLSQV